jgi:signal transduction histidine kinase
MQEVWSITNLADGNVIRSIGIFDMRLHSFWRELFKGWNNKEQFQHYWLAGKDKEEYIKILNETPNYLSQPIEEIPDVHIQSYFFGDGAVWANSIKPHSDEDKQIMKRFASVFSLTFRRYRDLQKAEAQAREARIEAALERVRSKTMAMHNSQDVGESVATLFDELVKLGVKTNRCGILIHNDPQFAEVWTAKSSANEKATLIIGKLEITMHPMLVGARASWVNKEPFFSFELKGQDMINYYQSINNSKYYPTQFNLEALPAKEIHSDFHFSDGSLFAFTNETLPTESAAIFKRFTSVFGQTYRRFLDLQKAEGQAREAQIEAALEKVRSRSLAMQKPEELVEVAELLRGEMGQLGVEELETSSIYLVDSENKQAECWYAIKDIRDGNKSLVSDEMTLLLSDTWVGSEMWKFFQSKKEQTSIFMKGDNRKDWINYCADKSQVLQGYYGNEIPERTYHLVKFNGGYMGAASPGEISPASWDLLRRAAAVFSFAYTRFKDLQDAEARARESQIQLALERVRSRTMAMQHSDELAEAAFVLFQQLQILGVVHERINIGVVKEESKTIDFWITEQGGNQINTRFTGRMDEPTTLSKMYKGWKMNKKSMVIDLSGADLKEWLRYLKEDIGIPFDPAFSHSRRVQTVGFFSKGMLVVTTPEPLPEENLQLLEKFSGVFDLTYTRFSDLKQAEAQARDAKIEVALERIRARALAMQSSTELSEVAKVLREQMGILGQEDLEASVVHLYSSDSPTFDSWYAYRAGDQMLEGSATFRVENSALAKEFLKLYEDDVTEYTLEVKGEKLNEWLAEIKINAPKIAAYWGDLPPEKQFYHFSDFSGGALLMVSHQNLSEETRMLQKRSASVFELAYKRFLDLEAKERQDKELREEKRRLEQALSELKATQSQLVQQEKLASLGQLTAGIAHEIKNPLNFVNNFSEVSIEMMGEIKEERAKNQDARDETLVDEILDDIQANLEKIHEHGTRANGIVTSMLQHSRGSSGKMEPTNLNGLIKEYVNLSFHGMRAGKNPIDVDIALDLDPQITDVPIIKEDFTRVVINLCNNAFDAMREKILKTEDRRRETEDGDSGYIKYDPKLKVITSLENGQARISIEDNGPGIPDEIKDKILQPFFTTKKGTEGTGLGLSITNDIIKAHGGELEIETSENKGTKFIIKLTK